MNLLDLVIVVAAVAYGIGGFRHGAVVGALSMIGFFGGAAVGAQLAEPIGSRLADGRAQTPVAILCVLVFAMIGQLIGAWIAGHVRTKVVSGRGPRLLDSGIGTGLGVASVLVVAWMVAVPLVHSPYPKLSAQASHSEIVRAVNGVMPDQVRTLYGSMRSFLDQSGFPPVFGDLPDGQPDASVAPPDPRLPAHVRAVVRTVHRSVLKIYGQAPRCNRGIEGSGFVYAPHRVVTNAHVVAGTDQVAVHLSENRSLPATVVLFDPQVDIAVLAVPGLDAPPLPLSRSIAPAGTPAVVLGYPQDGPYTARTARIRTDATVSGRNIYGQGNVERDIYAVRAIVRSGNSGGPLIDYSGTVLGMVFATALDSSDTGYALTSGQLRPDLNRGRSARVPVSTGACTPT